ncbi:hypothetical protein BDZ94DRAFT_254531 [Collybia nuda]|uniref:Uncharacterized protein n=1 Tax=Collybia nuda TaxID=64659 RepID=A0A9P5XX36_9AGAR|nr:hypothetical protein BDZ94DRAFT_254531 [Collybia nuda]
MASFEPLISDGIVAWKAFGLLRGRKWLRIPPLFLLVCSLALVLVNLVFATKQHNIDQWVVKTSLTISGGLSLGTNIVATSLIGYVYWRHRKSMVSNLGRERRPTQSERVLALLVESGAVFCLPQAIYFITQLFPELVVKATPGHYARQVFNAAYFIFSAMYPTLVTALTNGRSVINETYPSGSSLLPIRQYDAPSRITPLTFALPEAADKIMESPGTSIEDERRYQIS